MRRGEVHKKDLDSICTVTSSPRVYLLCITNIYLKKHSVKAYQVFLPLAVPMNDTLDFKRPDPGPFLNLIQQILHICNPGSSVYSKLEDALLSRGADL